MLTEYGIQSGKLDHVVAYNVFFKVLWQILCIIRWYILQENEAKPYFVSALNIYINFPVIFHI